MKLFLTLAHLTSPSSAHHLPLHTGILLQRLEHVFVFKGISLDWFKSNILYPGVFSGSFMTANFSHEVPQGSIHGPLPFTYRPFGNIIRSSLTVAEDTVLFSGTLGHINMET